MCVKVKQYSNFINLPAPRHALVPHSRVPMAVYGSVVTLSLYGSLDYTITG